LEKIKHYSGDQNKPKVATGTKPFLSLSLNLVQHLLKSSARLLLTSAGIIPDPKYLSFLVDAISKALICLHIQVAY